MPGWQAIGHPSRGENGQDKHGGEPLSPAQVIVLGKRNGEISRDEETDERQNESSFAISSAGSPVSFDRSVAISEIIPVT